MIYVQCFKRACFTLRMFVVLKACSVSAAFLLPPEQGGDKEMFSNLSQHAGMIMLLASSQLTLSLISLLLGHQICLSQFHSGTGRV